jgi:glucose/arabinose dehydrogenase
MIHVILLLQLAHHEIKLQDLPKPYASKDADNPPRIIPRPAGAELHVPPGFKVELWAEGLDRPRQMALAPSGEVFVAEPRGNRISVWRDGKKVSTFAEDLDLPFGIAFHDQWLYVGNTGSVVRFAYKPGQTRASGKPEKIATLPGRGYNQHWTRNVIFSPDGKKMYVTVGSETNVDVETEPMRAAISEFNPDGSGRRIYATGTRNPVGLAWSRGTLWAAVEERDDLGDDLPPDYVTSIQPGGFYGWPYAYAGPNEDPRRKGERPDLVKKTIVPDVLVQAHSAVLGLIFYSGKMFPPEYKGDAFVAFHGSWNRTRRTGYSVVRIRFKDGKPVGGYEDFLTGFMLDPDKKEVWGRPVGLLELPDGSLLVSDDGGYKIWRVTFDQHGGRKPPAPPSEARRGPTPHWQH